ncbi:S9 family peptidase [candidate division KSB1 bacterium]
MKLSYRKSLLTFLVIFIYTGGYSQSIKNFTLEQITGMAFPSQLVSAADTDMIAWITYEKGRRNVYTAESPEFEPVRLTSYTEDDGEDLMFLQISADGSAVIYVRGGFPDNEGYSPNPLSLPESNKQTVWAVSTSGGEPLKIAEAKDPKLSENGRSIIFVEDDQLVEVSFDLTRKQTERNHLFTDRGIIEDIVWSPDDMKIAFVSYRKDHSFIGIYDKQSQNLNWISPSTDHDGRPVWSPDGSQITFFRTPGNASFTPFSFPGGHMLEIWVSDIETGESGRIWYPPEDSGFNAFDNLTWVDREYIIFSAEKPKWKHFFSVRAGGGEAKDITPGEGLIEHFSISSDRKNLFYSSNINDIDRRHLWKTSITNSDPEKLTEGSGIETFPVILSSGESLAFMNSNYKQPQTVSIFSTETEEFTNIFPEIQPDFPKDQIVEPEPVIILSSDSLKIHCQLFLPKNLDKTRKHPAILFVHGGPERQMLLGWHYLDYYNFTYAFNQYLVNNGYIVLSVNYRGGIGYGRSFRHAEKTGPNGAAEYEDVLAAGKYLKSRNDVDPDRIGIWGGSYGGFLTAMACAKNPDIFAAGVDLNGIHLWDTEDINPKTDSFKSSVVAYAGGWTSPLLLVHGDDDRNVEFSQTTRFVQLMRANGTYYELLVFPNEGHDFLLYKNLLKFYETSADFLDRFIK